MPPFPFSALAEKLENVYGAIQSALELFPDDSEDPNVGPAWFTVARDQRQHSPLRFQTDSSSFSSEETDNSGSFRSMVDEGASRDADTGVPLAKFEAAQEGVYVSQPPPQMMYGKILPNIADFDVDDDHGKLYGGDSDTDSFYTSESSKGLAKVLQSSLSITSTPIMASDGQYYSTALPPPPRRKNDARGKLVFVPSDAPGTCPIHGCAGDPCSTCEFKDKPMLFSF